MVSIPISIANDPAALVEGLAGSRIVDPELLQAQLQKFVSETPKPSEIGFADFLVQEGLLTPYQARMAANGEVTKLSVGPFTLQEPIEDSDFGAEYWAVNQTDRQPYTVRVIPLRSLWKSREAKRHVARLASLATHTSLIPLADVDTAGGYHYLAWPYIPGELLSQRMDGEPMAPELAAKLFADLAEGLAICHAADVIHGLIQPSYILIGTDQRARMLNLGLGDILADTEGDDSMFDTISTSHAAIRRMDYTPPETATDPNVRLASGDAYSLGAVLYHAVAGVPPFPDGSVVEKMLAHMTTPPLPVRMRNPHIPAGMANLIDQLLSKSPADRPSMTTVRDVLKTEGQALPEAQPLSITASTLRDAAELSKTFQIRNRGIPEREMEGTVDFDLPVPSGSSPAPASAPPPPPSSKITRLPASKPPSPQPVLPLKPGPAVPPIQPPRTIVLPSATNAPLSAEKKPSSQSRANAPAPADLPRPVGWVSSPSKQEGSAIIRPEITPGPPRMRTTVRKLLRSLAFWLPQSDEIQVSLFGPPEIAPGQRVKFIAYSHLPEVSDNVSTLCRAMNKTAELLGAGHLETAVARGKEVVLQLILANAGVAKSTMNFDWTGQPQPKTFDVFVPWESPPGLASGTLTVSVGGAITATVPVHFVVLPRRS